MRKLKPKAITWRAHVHTEAVQGLESQLPDFSFITRFTDTCRRLLYISSEPVTNSSGYPDGDKSLSFVKGFQGQPKLIRFKVDDSDVCSSCVSILFIQNLKLFFLNKEGVTSRSFATYKRASSWPPSAAPKEYIKQLHF